MRARVSIVLAGFGKFVLMTSAFCIAMTIAITGPPTPSETAGVNAIFNHAVRRFDSAALNFSFDLCRRAAVVAHAAGLCATPATAVVRKDTPPQPVEVAAVSQTIPASVREILPPDTIDQITQPTRRTDLLGGGPSAQRHVVRPAHRVRAVARARAGPPRSRAVAAVGSRAAHVVAHPRRAPGVAAVRAAAARAHTVRPLRRAPASPVRVTLRPAPRAAPAVTAPATEPAAPHDDAPPVTTLDEQLERLTARPDGEADEPAYDDEDQPPLDEKSWVRGAFLRLPRFQTTPGKPFSGDKGSPW